MKKVISIFLLICVVMVSGCKSYSGEEIENTVAQKLFPDFQYDSSTSPYYQGDNGKIAIAEEGYYLNVNNSSKKIYYYDINSKTVTPLCSKIGCDHSTKECDACFNDIKGNIDKSGFVYYNHRLYMIAYDKENGTTLVSYNAQGLERKEEVRICADTNFIPVNGTNRFCIFDGQVYCWVVKFDNSDMVAKYRLYNMSIGKGEKAQEMLSVNITREQYDKFMSDPLLCLYPTKEALYVVTEEYDVEADKRIHKLYKAKKSDSSVSCVLQSESPRKRSSGSGGSSYIDMYKVCLDNNSNLYYVNRFKDGSKLYSYNLDTEEKKLIYSVAADEVEVMCDDEYIYVSVRSGLLQQSCAQLIIFDKNGGVKYRREIKRSELDERAGEYDSGGFVGVDERYVIIEVSHSADFDFNNEIVTYEIPNGDTCTYLKPTENPKLAIMLKSDIGTGNEKWIEMYNGMNVQ